jgi:putative radical SAM enzyme (TIGR03279 family)
VTISAAPHLEKKYKNQVEENEAPRIARNESTSLRRGAVIAEVDESSIAAELGIAAGEILLEINDQKARDAIQLKLADASEKLTLTVADSNGEVSRYEIEKETFEPLGIHLDAELFDGVTRCTNKCPFCFVDALPPRVKTIPLPASGGAGAATRPAAKNLRRTLYVRDDDYRLSFLHGHYITLTNLKDEDYARIIEEKLTPLCVSVHATDPATRIKMVGNKSGGDILERLRFLIDNGITVNAQIVLCPGLNDGEILEQSIRDLKGLWPGVESMAVVPVGLTKWLPPSRGLRTLTRDQARGVLSQLAPFQKECAQEFGARFVYASDEMYLLAESRIPPATFYDGYPQYANGVGMIRAFRDEVKVLSRRTTRISKRVPRISLVTGRLAAPYLRELAEVLRAKNLADARVIEIRNTFWGGNVGCAGLVMGQEILAQVKPGTCGEYLFLPPDAVDNQNRMLDDITLPELSLQLGTTARCDANGPLQLASLLPGLSS